MISIGIEIFTPSISIDFAYRFIGVASARADARCAELWRIARIIVSTAMIVVVCFACAVVDVGFRRIALCGVTLAAFSAFAVDPSSDNVFAISHLWTASAWRVGDAFSVFVFVEIVYARRSAFIVLDAWFTIVYCICSVASIPMSAAIVDII